MMVAPDLLTAALEVNQFCLDRGWVFCFIGGVAVQRWGTPRFTADLDLTLVTGYGPERGFINELLETLEPRRPDAVEFALTYRVFLARTTSGVDVDIALGAFPFEERAAARASSWLLEEHRSIRTCSAEDLIVHKVFAGRDRDWDDIRGVLARRHGQLDFTLIRTELEPLLELKEEPEAMQRLDRLIAEISRRLRKR